jgi:hypothetical protein
MKSPSLWPVRVAAVCADSSQFSLLTNSSRPRIAGLAEQTPSKGGSSLRHYKPRDPPRAAAVATQPAEYDDETEDSTFAGNLTVRSVAAGRSFHYGGRRGNPGDATFLTECSFDGVRDRLVEIITDVHPYVAYWEELRELNLEGRLAGSVARLKEFLPKLVEVNLYVLANFWCRSCR